MIVVTGGLGCAPVVSVINYIAQRREQYGKLKILHGVKTPKDLLYRERFRAWERHPNTEVYLTVDHPDKAWKYNVGVVTNLFDQVEIDPRHSMVMMCGPEIMMRYTARSLLSRGIAADRIYVSLERNMKCAIAFCGHCQLGPTFVCREGRFTGMTGYSRGLRRERFRESKFSICHLPFSFSIFLNDK